MKKIARTRRSHRELLLNYFKAGKEFSSGVVEGLNKKAKVTMRRSYSFRTFRVLELALTQPPAVQSASCEPPSTDSNSARRTRKAPTSALCSLNDEARMRRDTA